MQSHLFHYFILTEIRIPPQTQHLLLNVDQMATFFCQAVGIDAFWSIDDGIVPGHGSNTLIGKGWIFNETLILDTAIERKNIHNLTLHIPSNIEFNNTKIRCVSSVHDPAVSDPAYLIIKGTYPSLECCCIFSYGIYSPASICLYNCVRFADKACTS